MVEIVPSFDLNEEIPLLSFSAIGPLKAGILAKVPLWFALFLQQRTLCTISPPSWLTAENLSEIIAFERKHDELWADASRLPSHYYEISKRLTTRGVCEKAVGLLVQDLLEIRLDKLRQQFQDLLKDNNGADLIVAVNGIGSQELSILKGFIVQALNDQKYLSHQQKEPLAEQEERQETKEPSVLRARAPIRRFRK